MRGFLKRRHHYFGTACQWTPLSSLHFLDWVKNSWILSRIKAWIGNNQRPYSSFSYRLHHVISFIVIIIYYSCFYVPSFPVAQLVKNPPAMWETWVQIPGWGRSPGEGNDNHSSILACRIPWREEPGRLQSIGSQRVGHNWATSLSLLCSRD